MRFGLLGHVERVELGTRLAGELLCEPLTMTRIEDHGAEVRSGTPDELRALVDAELHKWRAVMTRSRIPDHRAEPEAAH